MCDCCELSATVILVGDARGTSDLRRLQLWKHGCKASDEKGRNRRGGDRGSAGKSGRSKAQWKAIPTAIVRKPCKDCGPISAPTCVREFISPPLPARSASSSSRNLDSISCYGPIGALLSASEGSEDAKNRPRMRGKSPSPRDTRARDERHRAFDVIRTTTRWTRDGRRRAGICK